MKPTRIVLTDAQQSFRHDLSNFLKSIPAFKVVAESCSGKEAGYLVSTGKVFLARPESKIFTNINR